MATIKLVPSTYSVSNNTVTVSNANNMYTDTSSTSYATITHTTSGTTSYYLYLKGFNFNDVPSNAQVSSIVIRIRGYETGLATSTSYAPRLYDNTSTISGASAASSNFGTSTSTITVPYTGTWDTLKGYGADLGIRLTVRRNQRNTQCYIYVYGAEIEVTYTAETVHVTGVSLDKISTSIDIGDTDTLTATVSPSNATDKSVSWSSSNTSVATVSGGIVTGVSAGTARITATTTDGGYTAYCDVTVTQPVTIKYKLTDTMEPGKSYIIANGNSGSVYMLTGEAGGSRTLVGASATVSDNIIELTSTQASRVLFDCVRYTAGNDITITVQKDGKYLYSDNSTGLRLQTSSSLDRFWHYYQNKFWQFKSTSNNGYTDTSSEYKYYITWNNGNATDNHVSTQSIQNSNIPLTYIFEEYTQPDESLYVKTNGNWVQASSVYKKVNGSWVLQNDLQNVFEPNTNYVKG